MQFNDQIDFIRQHIKKNRLRVFMTVLAATMGTAFLIVLASVGFGLHETMRDYMLSNRLVTEIQVHESDESGKPGEQVEELKKIDHVKAVVNRQHLGTNQQSSLGEFTGNHELVVTDFIEEGKAGFELEEGRLPEKANEVVVGSNFKEYLIYEQDENSEEEIKTYEGDLIGKQFSYQIGDTEGEFSEEKIPLTIVGIGKNPAKEWVQDQQIYVDISIVPELERIHYTGEEAQEAEYRKSNPLLYSNVNVYVDKLENVKAVSKKLKVKGTTFIPSQMNSSNSMSFS